jgi:hypothetical protein
MFQSYAHQCFSIEQLQQLAQQYHDVDMWLLLGQDENNFPFLIGSDLKDYRIVYWSKKHGIIAHHDDDPVRYYAFAAWLSHNAHPVFATLEAAERYAVDQEWPRLD